MRAPLVARPRTAAALAAALTAAALAPAVASAASGALDPTFGSGGRVVLDPDPGAIWRLPGGVAIDVDGRTLLTGAALDGTDSDVPVYRLRADGSRDPSFGGDGEVTLDEDAHEVGMNVALQRDRRILVGGGTGGGGDQLVHRLLADGTRDSTFGGGDGAVRLDAGAHEEPGRGLVEQADGRIVVVGTTRANVGAEGDVVVFRLLADGSLDRTFAGDGSALVATAGDDVGPALAVQPDGAIVVASRTPGSNGHDVLVRRLRPDGTLDPSFGSAGSVRLDAGQSERPAAVAVQPDGRIAIAGTTDAGGGDGVLFRLTASGARDGGFGSGGTVRVDAGGLEQLAGLALMADGRLVAAGVSRIGEDDDPIVVRLTADGARDASFDGDGIARIGGAPDEAASALALNRNGKPLVAGFARTPDAVIGQVWRLLG